MPRGRLRCFRGGRSATHDRLVERFVRSERCLSGGCAGRSQAPWWLDMLTARRNRDGRCAFLTELSPHCQQNLQQLPCADHDKHCDRYTEPDGNRHEIDCIHDRHLASGLFNNCGFGPRETTRPKRQAPIVRNGSHTRGFIDAARLTYRESVDNPPYLVLPQQPGAPFEGQAVTYGWVI